VLAAVLVAVLVVSLLFLSSASENFIFSEELTVKKVIDNLNDAHEPNCLANFSNSNNEIGSLYFRLERDFFNNSENSMFVSVHHARDIELDSVVFRFRTPRAISVHLDTSNQIGVTYVFSKDPSMFTIEAKDMGELGAMEGDKVFEFIIKSYGSKEDNLLLTVDLSMHYKTPMQLTSLKASVDINTYFPS
jgi:hypothetical protein